MKRILCLLCAAALALTACGPAPAASATPTAAEGGNAVFETTASAETTPQTSAKPIQTPAPARTWTDAVQGEIPQVTGRFVVTMLSVGKADCFVLQTENSVVIVDTGLRDTAERVTEWLDINNIYRVDALVLTHFDKDHVGGASEILEHVRVDTVYQADYEGTGKRYEKYLEAANDKGVPVVRVSEDTRFVLDDVLFELKPASEQLIKKSLATLSANGEPDENDCSLVLAAWHGNNSFAFLGDAEKPEIAELLREDIGPFTFVKVPHHGRYEENSPQLFRELSAQIAFITNSDDEDEDGSSAEPTLLRLLESLGTETHLSTDGTIQCISNGESLTTLKL